MKQQYYLDFEIADCRYAFLINQIPWFSDGSGGSLATRVLIHQFIHEGKNTLEVNIAPLKESGFGYTTYFEARIIAVDEEENEKTLLELKYRFDEENPLPVFSGNGAFEIETLSYSPATWIDCNIEKLEDSHRSMLTRHYNKIYKYCRTADLEGFMQIAARKDAFFIERFELNPAERIAYVREKFSEFFETWQFSNYDFSLWVLKSYANNRLFTFELANGISPIEFTDEKNQMKVNIPAYLTIVNDEVWWVL